MEMMTIFRSCYFFLHFNKKESEHNKKLLLIKQRIVINTLLEKNGIEIDLKARSQHQQGGIAVNSLLLVIQKSIH